MRIAFFIDAFLPYTSGVSVSVTNSSIALAKRGHKIIIFAPAPARGVEKPYINNNVKVEWLPSLKTFYPDLRIGAPTPKSFIRLKKFNPDIIHVHTPLLIGGEGIVGARILKKPLVFSFHTYFMDPESFKIVGIQRRVKIVEKALWDFTRKVSKSADVIIVPTKFVAGDLKRHKFPNRIEIIPTGIDLRRFSIDEKRKHELKRDLDLEGKIILGVGRLSYEKAWDFLLSAFQILYQRGERCTLVLIGKGPAEEQLRFLARILGIDHRVRFLGEIPNNKLIDKGYYMISDVFAMPSDFETQGVVTLEAMGFGLPIVALKSKGTIDLVGKYGILVKKSEKDFARVLRKVLSDSKLAQQLSQRSLSRAQDFSLENSTKKLEEVYLSV